MCFNIKRQKKQNISIKNQSSPKKHNVQLQSCLSLNLYTYTYAFIYPSINLFLLLYHYYYKLFFADFVIKIFAMDWYKTNN